MKKIISGVLLLIMIVFLIACIENTVYVNNDGDGNSGYASEVNVDFDLDGIWYNEWNEAITFSGSNIISECNWIGNGSGTFSIRKYENHYTLRFDFAADHWGEIGFLPVDENTFKIASMQYVQQDLLY